MRLFSFKSLVCLTFLFSLCVIALGAYTRLTEAGLGCPDWPGCYGFAGVPQAQSQLQQAEAAFPDHPVEPEKAWNEMVHRYFAGTLGLLILAINVIAWRRRNTPRLLPALLLGTVIFQAVLGMWTVTMALMPVVVMGHLLGGFTTAALLLLLALRIHRREASVTSSVRPSFAPGGKWLSVLAAVALLVTVGQVALGGWTAANYAAVVCTQLPVCEVDWVGQFDATAFNLIQPEHDSYQYGVLDYSQRVSIHVTHRLGAAVTTLVLLVLIWQLLQSGMRRSGIAVGSVLLFQLGLGITNVVASLPLMVAVGHNLGGVLLLLTLVATNYHLYCRRTTVRSDWYVAHVAKAKEG
ncbi:Heme A synthase, cytochrome oxidase biogenesis protein Cox15-CtaA [Photobacterium marinum]|uniref:Heme A synthase, cytochrome oxidase biogenesis protein Cox15-CtaA n=1 Tax=Photobacterium marinum TaxID=1056511 RepID=L8J908_9GAMM|nr:COX15/CtaA family protein [Photobacterium marinum]ELR64039.1 Heme A synthase, cytochrome oxidase biogenesis protein Cox15-CtaA [Photobacterium marinum]